MAASYSINQLRSDDPSQPNFLSLAFYLAIVIGAIVVATRSTRSTRSCSA